MQDAVAALCGLQGVVIYAFGGQGLTIEVVCAILANGVIDVFLLVGIYGDGDADFLCGESIVDDAGVGGRSDRR